MTSGTPEALRSDVTVVGYGPTGQVLALLLAQKNYRVTIVERWPSLYPLPRAVHFDHEAARILQSARVMDEIAAVGEGVGVVEWRTANGETMLELDWTGTGVTGWPLSTIFSQPELQAILDRHIKQAPLITVLEGWEAIGVSQDDDGIDLDLEQIEVTSGGQISRTGARVTVRADYLVGADGANSFVRRALGVDVNDLGFAYDWLVLDVIPRVEREWKPKSWQLCDPARPTSIVPGGPGRRRWEFMMLPGESANEMNRAEIAWKLLEPWDIRPDNADLERHTVYTFRGSWALEWRKGRGLLAGDAAHLMPPFLGQGMCSGLRDAAALAWRLDLVLKGLAHEGVLNSYGPERIAHVRTLIEASVELGKVICITDPKLAAQRDAQILAERANPDYARPQPLAARLGPGLFLEGTPGAGSLSPQATVAVDGVAGLFDDVFGVGFALVARTPADLAALSEDRRREFEALGARIIAASEIGDTEGVYHRWLDGLGSVVALVRPDFYVFGSAADAASVNELVSALLEMMSVSGSETSGEALSSGRSRAGVATAA